MTESQHEVKQQLHNIFSPVLSNMTCNPGTKATLPEHRKRQAACDLDHSYRGLTSHWTLQPRWWYQDQQVSFWTVKWMYGNTAFVHILLCAWCLSCVPYQHISASFCVYKSFKLYKHLLFVRSLSTSFCSLLFEPYIINDSSFMFIIHGCTV